MRRATTTILSLFRCFFIFSMRKTDVELTRRQLASLLGGLFATTLAGCSSSRNKNNPTNTPIKPMNLQVETQSLDVNIFPNNDPNLTRIVDEDHDKILYLFSYSGAWSMRVADIDSENESTA